ncbi:MAG: saccharopine dehydrogenase NADP-binding domain-containing protein [Alphaproteobacteria bacterium]|nr:saccharopine dehydrogenase NADP-binding domain-containing protein [Alphaproteobacteria bacterium]
MKQKFAFNGRIIIVGYGSVGRCTLAMLTETIDIPLSNIRIIDGEDQSSLIQTYQQKGVHYDVNPIYPHNLNDVLQKHAKAGDVLLNLSVSVSSIDLMNWCHDHQVLYLDTCIEPWEGYYDNPKFTMAERSNYHLRYSALENAKRWGKKATSALITHGANPGLISHFVKAALIEISKKKNPKFTQHPKTQSEWANLSYKLGVKVIQVAEHDTQISNHPKRPDEFVNTWSIDGFYSEGMQPAELGWGSHEKKMPKDGYKHTIGSRSAIYLGQPGLVTEVRSWTPLSGPMNGFCITHGEAISLSDYLTVKEKRKIIYRPTVYYAYHPCNDAVLSMREVAMKNWHLQKTTRLLNKEIIEGGDELGALLLGDHGGLWYGSLLNNNKARQLLDGEFSATSLQIAAPVVAGAIWLIKNPNQGLVEPEALDYQEIIDICLPYLGDVKGVWTDWTPLKGRNQLFKEENIDDQDPWQFQNFRLS